MPTFLDAPSPRLHIPVAIPKSDRLEFLEGLGLETVGEELVQLDAVALRVS